MKIILTALMISITSMPIMAKTINIKNRVTKEIINITSEKSLCDEDTVRTCHFANVTLIDGDMRKQVITVEDKISIYTVADTLSRAYCKGAYNCKYELPYAKTVNVVKEFKAAATIQAPFYLVSDTIRLPYLIGKGIVQTLKNKMSKGRKIIKNIDPLKSNKKRIKKVKFNEKNFADILRTIESID